jgi:hypothetical protein
MGQVIIGMDPHKRSATIEVINDREKVLGQGRFSTDRDDYPTMLKLGRQHEDRIWAVEAATASVNTSPSGWSPTANRHGRAREAVRPRQGVRHRSTPQDRRERVRQQTLCDRRGAYVVEQFLQSVTAAQQKAGDLVERCRVDSAVRGP